MCFYFFRFWFVLMMLRRILAVALLMLPVFASAAQAQSRGTATLVGIVTDAETGDPLPGANVIIAGSTRGAAADENGRYELRNVPIGAQRLYVSVVGYEAGVQNLNLREPGIVVTDFALAPDPVEIGEVVVEAERDEQWLRRFERFKEAFIGETPNAEQVEILNPEVISFSGRLSNLTAYAAEPLEIENQALGYRLTYFLKDFRTTRSRTQWDGEPLFEPMEGTLQEQATWDRRRREAYLGSFHHLMLALLAEQPEEQQFRLYMRPMTSTPAVSDGPFAPAPQLSRQRFPLNDVSEILEPGATDNERVLDFDGAVEVVYTGATESEAYRAWQQSHSQQGSIRRGERFQTSQIWLERGPATIDYKGDIVDPYGVTRSGYFAFKRIADQLPKEYRPWR
jgi:hypothetical protein